jgi:photosystem II stability/assembly factor-like uncharacterized protein
LRTYTLSHSVGLASPRAIDGSGFIYGTADGVLTRVRPGQQATYYDVGARSSVEAVLVSAEGDWFVGGELGLLSVSKNQGRTWQSIRGDLPFGVIVDLAQWHDQIIVTTLRHKDVFIHAAATGSAHWRQLAHYQIDFNRFSGVPGERAQSFLVRDGLITTIPGRKMAYLDLKTEQSDIRSLPGMIQKFSVSADGTLRCRCKATIAVNPYESHDLGLSWKDSNVSRFMMMPVFQDEKHGIALETPIGTQYKMLYTEDGGVTWVESMDAPLGVRQMFYSHDPGIAYVGTAYGQFWMTHDNGKSWKPLSN